MKNKCNNVKRYISLLYCNMCYELRYINSSTLHTLIYKFYMNCINIVIQFLLIKFVKLLT